MAASAPAGKYKIDMTQGAILPKLIRFTLPLIAANSLQLVFHAFDLMVIGNFASTHALAAIGATTVINTLIVTFFAGIAIGTNVLVARYFGARDHHRLHLTVHTSAAFALWGGLVLTAIAVAAARPLLELLETPKEILPSAALYLRISFLGLPFVMLYNIGAAVLRAFGDTRRPLYFLLISAFLKALLNVLFVIGFKFDVPGVACATVLSQSVMGLLILRTLLHGDGAGRLRWKQIPARIPCSRYSISNVLILSSINSFGAAAIAGNTAASSMEGIMHVGSLAFYQAAMSFSAQNHGAGRIDRVCRCILICIGAGALVSGGSGLLFAIFGKPLLQIFTTDPEAIRCGLIKMNCMFTVYFSIGVMESISGSLRGLGYSTSAMITTVTGVCGLCIAWVLAVFPHFRSLMCLYISYPISWTLVSMLNGALLWYVCRKLLREQRRREAGTARQKA